MTAPIHPQFITDADGRKLSVIISIEEYRAVLEELDMQNDIELFDAAMQVNEPTSPASEVYARIEAQRKGQ